MRAHVQTITIMAASLLVNSCIKTSSINQPDEMILFVASTLNSEMVSQEVNDYPRLCRYQDLLTCAAEVRVRKEASHDVQAGLHPDTLLQEVWGRSCENCASLYADVQVIMVQTIETSFTPASFINEHQLAVSGSHLSCLGPSGRGSVGVGAGSSLMFLFSSRTSTERLC
ncbi:hypothetical protein XENOCAPTIV_018330 [Xenoophorus captivus]|uniref:Lipoprotein n=1 Tax=Xenoophorus captivus TaxID=1517983 RepID=A0ABV0RST7_9TELE